MAIETAPLLLSSRQEVESIWSIDGVDLRIDDGDDGVTAGTGGTANDEQLLIDALIEGSDEAYGRLLGNYEADVLASSLWVRRRVSYIVCHLISLRKGNPAQYCAMYDRYIAAFIRVAAGGFIPSQGKALKPRANFQPTMSNVAVDHWHGVQKLRVIVDASEGPRDSKQFEDHVFRGFRGWWF